MHVIWSECEIKCRDRLFQNSLKIETSPSLLSTKLFGYTAKHLQPKERQSSWFIYSTILESLWTGMVITFTSVLRCCFSVFNTFPFHLHTMLWSAQVPPSNNMMLAVRCSCFGFLPNVMLVKIAWNFSFIVPLIHKTFVTILFFVLQYIWKLFSE